MSTPFMFCYMSGDFILKGRVLFVSISLDLKSPVSYHYLSHRCTVPQVKLMYILFIKALIVGNWTELGDLMYMFERHWVICQWEKPAGF